eukprot:g13239.t1
MRMAAHLMDEINAAVTFLTDHGKGFQHRKPKRLSTQKTDRGGQRFPRDMSGPPSLRSCGSVVVAAVPAWRPQLASAAARGRSKVQTPLAALKLTGAIAIAARRSAPAPGLRRRARATREDLRVPPDVRLGDQSGIHLLDFQLRAVPGEVTLIDFPGALTLLARRPERVR